MPKSIDLTGMKFGKLTVLNKTDKKEDNYLTWLCRCDCGNEITVNTKRLKRGTVTDCGCEKILRLGPKAEDLTGMRFGRLVAEKRCRKNRHNRVCWVCRCDCGNETTVTAHELKCGKTKSCGCLKREASAQPIDITGQKFSRLTALYPTEGRDSNGSVLWACRCDCGKEVFLPAYGLKKGNYKSCGCGKVDRGRELQASLTFVDGTCLEWIEKRKHRSDNTSGFTGVYKTRNGKFKASIMLSSRSYYLGTFDSLDDAVKARKYAEEVLHEGFIAAYKEWEEESLRNPEWAEHHPFHFNTKITEKKIKAN